MGRQVQLHPGNPNRLLRDQRIVKLHDVDKLNFIEIGKRVELTSGQCRRIYSNYRRGK